jgi:DNA polymerase I-like protein with 3'-5' exonuclease and polymerase domains
MEADFSMLEIIVLAHLTQDETLIADIMSGKDLHTIRAAELFKKREVDVTKAERKLAKGFSFQLQYGSGAKKMAEQWGVDITLAQQFIRNYYKRYPKVKEWQDQNIKHVEDHGYAIPEKSYKGYPIRESKLRSETGRVYTFKEEDAPEYLVRKGRRYTSFKPTEIKNYPVQGLATGDIVPMVLGKLHRQLISKGLIGKAKLINTVHDSIVLDVHKEVVYTISRLVKRVMEAAPIEYEKIFGVPFTLPLRVEVSWGDNWMEQTETLEV